MEIFTKSRRMREQIDALNKKFDQLTQMIAAQNQPHSVGVPEILASVIDGQAKQVDSTSAFIRMIHEISLERMASAMGRRGGKKRAANAQRDSRGRMLPARKVKESGDCPLCDDPQTADFSIAQFEAHQAHKRGSVTRERRESQKDSEQEPFDVSPEPQRQPPQYPLPVVQRPGENGEAANLDDEKPDVADAKAYLS
jgi:hypothetical protein